MGLAVLVISCYILAGIWMHSCDALSKNSLRVASFNIRHFGDSLMSHEDSVNIIKRIFDNFDVVSVMETRDADLSSVQTFINILGEEWNYTNSAHIGRTRYKESYVVYFRKNAVDVLDTYQYDDTTKDVFEREPYAVLITYFSPQAGKYQKVALATFHATPRDVFNELKALPKVMDAIQDQFNPDAVIAVGDFNADCDYLNNEEAKNLTIFKNSKKYRSLIPDSADTTVAATDCAYDRIIVQGDVPLKDARVFNFQDELNLSYSDAWGVSDHYPVAFTLL